MSLNIVFMGTPEFSVPTLEALINNKLNVVKVYGIKGIRIHQRYKDPTELHWSM